MWFTFGRLDCAAIMSTLGGLSAQAQIRLLPIYVKGNKDDFTSCSDVIRS
jgi:hypothetical protein